MDTNHEIDGLRFKPGTEPFTVITNLDPLSDEEMKELNAETERALKEYYRATLKQTSDDKYYPVYILDSAMYTPDELLPGRAEFDNPEMQLVGSRSEPGWLKVARNGLLAQGYSTMYVSFVSRDMDRILWKGSGPLVHDPNVLPLNGGLGFKEKNTGNYLRMMRFFRDVARRDDETNEFHALVISARPFELPEAGQIVTTEAVLDVFKQDWSVGAWGDRNIETPETVIEGLPRQAVAMVVAKPDTGKSSFMRNVAVHAALGRPFAGLVNEGRGLRVLYLDWETPAGILLNDLRKMADAVESQSSEVAEGLIRIRGASAVDENVSVFPMDFLSAQLGGVPLKLSNHVVMDALRRYVEGAGFDLIVVDTIRAGWAFESENDASEVEGVMGELRGVAVAGNCGVVFLHHISKQSENAIRPDDDPMFRFAGSTAFVGQLALSLHLDRQVDPVTLRETLYVHTGKYKYKSADRMPKYQALTLDPLTRLYAPELDAFISDSNKAMAELKENRKTYDAVLLAISELQAKSSDGARRADIVAHVQGVANTKSTAVDAALSEALEAGRIYQPKYGRYRLTEG
jgi:hypothetical protein